MRHVLKLGGIFAVGGALSLFACSSTPAPATDAGPGTDIDASVVDSAVPPRPDAGRPDANVDAGPPPGPNCAQAVDSAINTETAGKFTSAGQSIYFKVAVPAGEFLLISAETAAKDSDARGDVVDTTLSVFDTAGTKLLASIDDSFPRTGTDALLIYRAPAATTLCIRVTDFDTWGGTPAVLAKDSNFKFSAGAFNPASDALTVDAEPNDTIPTAQAGKLKAATTPPGAYTFINGFLKDAADVDVFKFTVPAGATSMGVDIPPIGAPLAPGKSSYGSTLPRFTATVSKLDGTIVGQVVPPAADIEKTSDSLTLPVEPGDYYLTVARPAGVAAGANDFYATQLSFNKGNPPEAETTSGTNDTLATAEALTMTADPANPKLKHGYIMAKLPTGDAADSFSFPLGNGDSVSLACGSARNGSGLQDFKVELFTGGTSRQTDTEVATTDMFWSSASGATGATKPAVVASAAGTAVLQLTAGSRSATNTGVYYLCGVHVTSP